MASRVGGLSSGADAAGAGGDVALGAREGRAERCLWPSESGEPVRLEEKRGVGVDGGSGAQEAGQGSGSHQEFPCAFRPSIGFDRIKSPW